MRLHSASEPQRCPHPHTLLGLPRRPLHQFEVALGDSSGVPLDPVTLIGAFRSRIGRGIGRSVGDVAGGVPLVDEPATGIAKRSSAASASASGTLRSLVRVLRKPTQPSALVLQLVAAPRDTRWKMEAP